MKVHHHYHHHMVRLVDVVLVTIIIILFFLYLRAKGYIINPAMVSPAAVPGINPSYQGNSYNVGALPFDLSFNPWSIGAGKNFSNTTTNCGCGSVGFGGYQYGAETVDWKW